MVVSSNANDAEGDYLCLPTANLPQTPSALLSLEDVTDANGNTVPCAGSLASGQSTVFTFPDTTICPSGWSTEYVGYLAANPNWPGENVCVDTSIGAQLSQSPCKNLAVIKKSAKNAYTLNVVSCVVCSL